MKYKILHGKIDGKHFVVSIFDDKKITAPMEAGLKRFFDRWDSLKLKEKTKKESDSGYLSLSRGALGHRRE